MSIRDLLRMTIVKFNSNYSNKLIFRFYINYLVEI